MYPPFNVMSRLLLSKSAGPKVIIINGFHCITFTVYLFAVRKTGERNVLFSPVIIRRSETFQYSIALSSETVHALGQVH